MSNRVLLIVLAVVAIAAAGWYMTSNNSQMGSHTGQKQPTAVSSLELKSEIINREEILPGRISAFKQAEIRPQVNGIITRRLYEEGSIVEKGQPLYQVDDTPYRASLASARADLVSAQANLRATTAREGRYVELIKSNAVSGQAYDDVKADLEIAKASIAVANASVEVAEVNLGYTRVYAPISGRISRSSVTEGALVTTNQSDSLAMITQLDPIYVDISQPGEQAMRLRNEMVGNKSITVQIILDSTTNLVHPEMGELKFSDVVIDETTGSVGLRALIPNSDETLLPGLFVRARINLGEKEVVLVPQRATIRDPHGELSVWVIDNNNQVNPKSIVVSGAYKDQWIVVSGVKAGESIVIEGYQRIASGMTVAPSPWSPNQ